VLLLRMVADRFDPLICRPSPKVPAAAVHLAKQIENEKWADGWTELRVAKQVFYGLD
jgi:hypothetical protein